MLYKQEQSIGTGMPTLFLNNAIVSDRDRHLFHLVEKPQ